MATNRHYRVPKNNYDSRHAKQLEKWKGSDYEVLEHANELTAIGIRVLVELGWRHHEAEDIAYEALYHAATGYKAELGPLEPYYYRTVRYYALNAWNSVQRYTDAKKRYRTSMPRTHTSKEVELRHDVDWLLTNTTDTLAYTMHEVYRIGRTYHEVAKRDGVNTRSIEFRVARAKPVLRRAWEDEMKGGHDKND